MCQDTGTAIVMGKRGEHVLTDRRRSDEARHQPRRRARLHRAQPALLADGAAHDVGRDEHRHEPAGADRALPRRPATSTSCSSWRRAAARPTSRLLFQETKALLTPAKLLDWLDDKLRTLGTAACPPYHLALVIGGTSAEFALKTAKYASARYLDTPADVGLAVRPRLPRPRARGRGAGADAALRHRRPVRRQVLLPRRAGDPPAAPRRVVPGRRRRVVLRRPAGAGEDHRRGRVPRAARDRPRALPPRARRRGPVRRRRARRPVATDGRDPRRAHAGTR